VQLRRAHERGQPIAFRATAEKGLAITLADYAKSYEARSKLARDMARWHRKYDLLLAPVTPTSAPPVETLNNSDAFPRWTKGASYTLPFNLTGQPAASMPAGLTRAGLPSACRSSAPRAPTTSCSRRCGPTKARAAGRGRRRK
jgi:aspartyl-tRNA(Asn)/glutamyl-tRNA(Gln) amidotransferase subunit A